jgi:hypothetical protein
MNSPEPEQSGPTRFKSKRSYWVFPVQLLAVPALMDGDLVGLVAVLTSGVQFFLTAEFLFHSDRTATSYEFATSRSFPFTSFLAFLIPWSNDVRELAIGADPASGHADPAAPGCRRLAPRSIIRDEG